MTVVGIDIGGTKTAVLRAVIGGDGSVKIDKAGVFPTFHSTEEPEKCPYETLNRALELVDGIRAASCEPVTHIGVACGGPLDEKRGLILAPPNLPEWDSIPVVRYIEDNTGIPCTLCNDANACALAEWKFGAGRGTDDMVFLTFGTGFGAGVISGGRLVSGAAGSAGEIGHVMARPDEYGILPVGYGVKGSYEGYCSGGGIKQIARYFAEEALASGRPAAFCKNENELDGITAKTVADAARAGDETALKIYRMSARYLGEAAAVLSDLFDPERIVVGGIYARCVDLMEPIATETMKKLALPASGCVIVPSGLGEAVGDYSCVAAVFNAIN